MVYTTSVGRAWSARSLHMRARCLRLPSDLPQTFLFVCPVPFSGKYKMVRINYANPDMVGHTGDLAATIKSCEVVDACVKELLEVADSVNAR